MYGANFRVVHLGYCLGRPWTTSIGVVHGLEVNEMYRAMKYHTVDLLKMSRETGNTCFLALYAGPAGFKVTLTFYFTNSYM